MDERSSRIEARLEIPMLIAAALVVPLLIIEQSASTHAWQQIALVGNWIVWIAFAVEVVVMLSVVPDRWLWIRKHPLECIVVLLTFPLLPASMRALRAVRLVRLLRLAIFARRARRLFTAGGVGYAALLSAVLIIAGGAALRVAEPGLDLTFDDAVWWALTTATTVGYGDIAPETDIGRLIAGLVMVIGIGFIALLTASMASQFLEPAAEAIEADEREELRLLREMAVRIEQLEHEVRRTRP